MFARTKNIQLLPVTTRLRALQQATDESHTLPQRVAQKRYFAVL